MNNTPWALALHGGAGTILRSKLTKQEEARFREGLADALRAGTAVLEKGGAAIDAVERTVIALEENPMFNAGRGSVLTSEGGIEMDAAIMDGRNLDAGAVIGLNTVRNPISLARLVMEKNDHVVLAGKGAEAFARERGLQSMPTDWFVTERRRNQLEEARKTQAVSLDHNDGKYGTVGAVARDMGGNLAAATSTGGMTNKAPGRVGDAPLIGAGTYASNRGCAVSATGHGEMFIRLTVARDIAAMMEYLGLDLEEAVRRKVHDELPALEGAGGLIAVGPEGLPVLSFNTPGMYRASRCAGESEQIAIFEA
ncbi:isoaspartyl peptidase/L-asparaginase family protein [Nitratireductor pacificus]|uniref:Isoaspartyl peptidase n=1 Tax=Nitratireductor pacificus pht-3B TaxID=391937 RepID=K2N368_9HYPH|nr:isoaspartyl peptidase/L-asparaginase [Nitratireductor pacificus]EKF18628.1 asparaginase [Nitratireductor pacificus pht-3B]